MSSTDSGQTLKKKCNNLRNRGNGCPPLPCSTFGQRKGQIQTGLVLTVDQGKGRQWRQLEKKWRTRAVAPTNQPFLDLYYVVKLSPKTFNTTGSPY